MDRNTQGSGHLCLYHVVTGVEHLRTEGFTLCRTADISFMLSLSVTDLNWDCEIKDIGGDLSHLLFARRLKK